MIVGHGNTAVVIEHNLVIKTADWVIDLGPDEGDKGGEIVVVGTPEAVSKCKRSFARVIGAVSYESDEFIMRWPLRK